MLPSVSSPLGAVLEVDGEGYGRRGGTAAPGSFAGDSGRAGVPDVGGIYVCQYVSSSLTTSSAIAIRSLNSVVEKEADFKVVDVVGNECHMSRLGVLWRHRSSRRSQLISRRQSLFHLQPRPHSCSLSSNNQKLGRGSIAGERPTANTKSWRLRWRNRSSRSTTP